MQLKAILCTIVVLFSLQSFSTAFSDSTIAFKDLKLLVGCWNGSLTYLDYSTSKPFTMPANVEVFGNEKNNFYVFAFSYPREPKANNFDTVYLSHDGRLFNKKAVKQKTVFTGDSLQLITEVQLADGNDNKAALIRHTYNLGRTIYTLKKEVQFIGTKEWILRNEYRFARAQPCK